MKKIVKLTESDLVKLIQKVIQEQVGQNGSDRKCGCAEGMGYNDLHNLSYDVIFCESAPNDVIRKAKDLYMQWGKNAKGLDNKEELKNIVNESLKDFKVYIALNDLVKKLEGQDIRSYGFSFNGFLRDNRQHFLPNLNKAMKQYC